MDHFKSVDDVVAARLKAMQIFLADYSEGLGQGRYVRSGAASRAAIL